MKAGRHRSFDKDIALDKAMETFWTNGYPGTSLADLTNAMGINKPSLYSAFGNKETLFSSALNRFVEKYNPRNMAFLQATDKSLRERMQGYLESIAKVVTDSNLPGGCLVCISTVESGGSFLPPDANKSIVNINEITKSTLKGFFKDEIAKGNMSKDCSPKKMANYLMAQQFGLAVMARNGASFDELKEVISIFVTNF